MEAIEEIFIVIVVTILVVVGLFVGMIINHERERKKENNGRK
jgi:hypothetical protein